MPYSINNFYISITLSCCVKPLCITGIHSYLPNNLSFIKDASSFFGNRSFADRRTNITDGVQHKYRVPTCESEINAFLVIDRVTFQMEFNINIESQPVSQK